MSVASWYMFDIKAQYTPQLQAEKTNEVPAEERQPQRKNKETKQS